MPGAAALVLVMHIMPKTSTGLAKLALAPLHAPPPGVPDEWLPKKLLFGQAKEFCPPGRPRSRFNGIALCDCQNCRIKRPCWDAQNRLLWIDKSRRAHT